MVVSRRVRRLRISAPSDSLGRRGRILLEDALHTASMPAIEGGRLLLVRSLSVGVIHPYESSCSIANRIGELFRHLNAVAVHGDDPLSEAAPVAYFEDPVAPFVCLSRRLCRQESLTSWVWTTSCRPWTPAMPRDEALRLMLTSSMDTSVGAAGALVLLRCLLRHQAIAPMLAALRWQDGAALLQAFGWPRHLPSGNEPKRPFAVGEVPWRFVMTSRLQNFGRSANAHHWFTAWGIEDARSLWLAAALLSLESPVLLESSSVMSSARDFVEAVISQPELIAVSGNPADAPPNTASAESPIGGYVNSDAQPKAAVRGIVESEGSKGAVLELTDRAGLFYLVQALRFMRIGEWLASHPSTNDQRLPVLLLREIAERLKTPTTDPALLAIEDDNEDDRSLLSPELQIEIKEWLRRVRRFCRLRAKICLLDLVCRRGLISLSLTHLDVTLALHGIDPRVRRSGLDIDPGWVPWLGRVVKFHYIEGDLLHGH